MSSQTQDTGAIPEPGFGHDCVISRHHLEILLRGAESEKEIGYRNLSAGIAISCGFGTLSTIAPHFGELFSIGANLMQSILLILLIATTLASSALAVFFHRRLQVGGSHRAYRLLGRHVRAQLEHPAELDDPRHWP